MLMFRKETQNITISYLASSVSSYLVSRHQLQRHLTNQAIYNMYLISTDKTGINTKCGELTKKPQLFYHNFYLIHERDKWKETQNKYLSYNTTSICENVCRIHS